MTNNLVFFDLDGPILDVADRHHRVYAKAVAALGGKPLDLQTFWSFKRQKTAEIDILRQSQVSAEHMSEFQVAKLAHIEAGDFLRFDTIQPGVISLLRRLVLSHHLVLVTLRNSRPALEKQLNELQLTPFFAAILSGRESSQEGWRVKTNLITGFQSILRKTDWIIGDTETDIRAGQHLKIQTAAVCNGIRSEHFLRELNPDCVLASAANFIP